MSPASAPPAKQCKKLTALVEGDVEATEAVTHETVIKITRSGATKRKTVLVPLVPITEPAGNTSMAADDLAADDPIEFEGNYENADL
jgi:hypothetical protein